MRRFEKRNMAAMFNSNKKINNYRKEQYKKNKYKKINRRNNQKTKLICTIEIM